MLRFVALFTVRVNIIIKLIIKSIGKALLWLYLLSISYQYWYRTWKERSCWNIQNQIILFIQNNYERRWLLECQNFLQHHIFFLHNYFDGPTKLFSDLYLPKFLDTSATSFFSCIFFFCARVLCNILSTLSSYFNNRCCSSPWYVYIIHKHSKYTLTHNERFIAINELHTDEYGLSWRKLLYQLAAKMNFARDTQKFLLTTTGRMWGCAGSAL